MEKLTKIDNNHTYEYIVWIGGVPNSGFNSLLEAELEAEEWIEKGYDDVVIESILTNK